MHAHNAPFVPEAAARHPRRDPHRQATAPSRPEHGVRVHAGDVAPELLDAAVLCGTSVALRNLARAVHGLAAGRANVAIQGEPGSGRLAIARALCARSGAPRVLRPADIDAEVSEQILAADRPGALGSAKAEGTLYVADIDSLPFVLQDRLATRLIVLGNVAPRILAGSARPLAEQVRLGRFSPALYAQVGLVQIAVPPLRDRVEDVTAIARVWREYAARQHGTAPPNLSRAGLDALCAYGWPGNLHELLAALEQAWSSAPGTTITAERLRAVLGARKGSAGIDVTPLARVELDYIVAAITRCGGNQSLAARRLGIARGTLWRKVRALEVEVEVEAEAEAEAENGTP